MAGVTPLHIAIIACLIVGIIIPIHQFKTKCNNVEAQFISDKAKHKDNIASLHEQCQQQLDEHLTAKQESFQRQIDRLKEQYQTKLEEEHQKILSDAGEIFKYKTMYELKKSKESRANYQLQVHQEKLDKIEEQHRNATMETKAEHDRILEETKLQHKQKISDLEKKIQELTMKMKNNEQLSDEAEIAHELEDAKIEKDIEVEIENALEKEGKKKR